MTEARSAREAARLLRQRVEMGGGEIFLDGLSREEALRLARAATTAPPVSASSPAPASPGGAAATAPAGASPPRPRAASPGGSGGARPRASGPPAPPGRSGGSGPEADGPAAGARGPSDLPSGYEELRSVALECTRCGLCRTRTQVVFSDGPPDARLMVVGEAPGANEDETGLPFVGAAGRYLDLLLATVDLSREDSVYIANVLKCRPPGNRNPLPEEIEACSPFLRKQIDLVKPSALLAVGSFSGKLLTGEEKSSLGKLRGRVHAYQGVPLVVTYHPAALLRNPNWTRAFWDDLQLLRDVMEADGSL